MRTFVWIVSLTCLGLGQPAAFAADEGLEQLMQQMAERQHGHVAFEERDFIGVLTAPLDSSGELLYDAPDRLEKRTLKPKPESVVLEKGMLLVKRGSRQYSFSLDAYPQIAALIDSLRATLAGDLPALRRTYDVAFDADKQSWTLVLTPLAREAKASVKQIRLAGSGDMIQTVDIQRTDGDRSTLTIHPLPAQ